MRDLPFESLFIPWCSFRDGFARLEPSTLGSKVAHIMPPLGFCAAYLAYYLDYSVFIFKPDLQRMQLAEGRLVVEHILPIVGEFYMNMAQPRRNTIDLRVNPTSALKQPRTGNTPPLQLDCADPAHSTLCNVELTLSISPGHDPSLDPISLLVRDTQHLRNVLAECKRLKQLAGTSNEVFLHYSLMLSKIAANYEVGVTPIYSWLLPYAIIPVPSIRMFTYSAA